MSRTTETPASLTDFGDGIGVELTDLSGIAVLCRLATEGCSAVDLDEDDQAALFCLIAHTVDRLNARVREVDAAVIEARAEARKAAD